MNVLQTCIVGLRAITMSRPSQVWTDLIMSISMVLFTVELVALSMTDAHLRCRFKLHFLSKFKNAKRDTFFCTAFFRVNDALKTALFLLCLHRVGLLSIG